MPSLLKLKKKEAKTKEKNKSNRPFFPPPTQLHPEWVQSPTVVQAGGCSVSLCTHISPEQSSFLPVCSLCYWVVGLTGGRRVALETLMWKEKKKAIKEKPRHVFSAFVTTPV